MDSGDDSRLALPAARTLAQRYGTVVAVTGAQDFITDGERTWRVDDGHPLMARVTGTGCALSAVVAACCALPGDRLDHVAASCKLMAWAGRLTAAQVAGPGSFTTGVLDTLYALRSEDLQ